MGWRSKRYHYRTCAELLSASVQLNRTRVVNLKMSEATARTSIISSVRRSVQLLRQLAGKYEDTIVRDPDLTTKLESTLKVASYIIPGAL